MEAFCPVPGQGLQVAPTQVPLPDVPPPNEPGELVLGGGCFWCTEAVFQRVRGVLSVVSGYAGGHPAQANYDAVCSGVTGHAEVIRIQYDPETVGVAELLRVFLTVAHDPTQKDRQGNDVGSQYRSVVFTADADFADWLRSYLRRLDSARVFAAPLATTVETLRAFHPAEAYHQGYADRHPGQPYVAAVALPKQRKLAEYFSSLVRR